MNDPIALSAALAAWQAIPGVGQVLDGDAAQRAYGADTGGSVRTLAGALKIVNRDAGGHGYARQCELDTQCVAQVMQIARQYKIRVAPLSTGRNWGYGTALPAGERCVIVDLSGLCQFDVEPVLGTVSVQPGVTQQMLADYLDRQELALMVPVTGAGPQASLLGNALERGYGVTPHTDHFGAVTDLEAVLADGSLYRSLLREAGNAELARLFKWNLGPYLNGVFTQSGLGIVTTMTIVLARRPETVKVCLFSLKDDALLEPAIERIRHVLGLLPGTVGGLNLMNRHRVLAMTAPYPVAELDADGLMPDELVARLGRQYQIAPWTGFGTLYGTPRMVAAAQKEIRHALRGIASRMLFFSPNGARTLAQVARWLPGSIGNKLAGTAGTLARSLDLVAGRPNETALPLAYWRNRGVQPAQGRDPGRDGCGLLWYAPLVPMRAADAKAYVAMATKITRAHGMEPLLTFTSINERLFDSTVPLLFDRADPDAVARAHACYAALLEAGRAIGVFPYRVGVDTMEKLGARHTQAGAFHARLRHAFDPDNLLSPGRYLENSPESVSENFTLPNFPTKQNGVD